MLIDWFKALGPFAAATVAVGIALSSSYRDRRRRPRLRLLYDHGSRDDLVTDVGPKSAPEHHLRLRVTNDWGKHTAEDVSVSIVGQMPISDRPSLSSYSVAWTSQVLGGDPVTSASVPPGAARYLEFGTIIGPYSEGFDAPGPVIPEGERPADFHLKLAPTTTDDRHVLRPGLHVIIVVLTARDTDAVYYGVSVEFDGKWWSGKLLREHFRVSINQAFYPGLLGDAAWRRMQGRWWRLIRLRWWLRDHLMPGSRGRRRERADIAARFPQGAVRRPDGSVVSLDEAAREGNTARLG